MPRGALKFPSCEKLGWHAVGLISSGSGQTNLIITQLPSDPQRASPPTDSSTLLAQARILEQKRERNGGERQCGHDHHRGGDANEVTDEAC